ncbi:hypothetical protein LIER_18439 [Lithospermum erythrorhizon]|uniref:Uncharacterized protein n=1 Tax=Lithospermum erythrorhizon TaxID=34254 RepID=A0AAV3QE00_LITER
MLGCANVSPAMLDSSSPGTNYRTDLSNLQPYTYTFLKYFYKFPVELAGLQAQFEKLQDITNQLSGIPKISPKLDVIDHNVDINDNLDVTFGVDKYEMEPNMNNTSSIISFSWNFESMNTFSDELETNKICASAVFDENPKTDKSYYVDAGLVIYDEYYYVDDQDLVLREVALNLDYICSKQIDNNSCNALAMNCRSMASNQKDEVVVEAISDNKHEGICEILPKPENFHVDDNIDSALVKCKDEIEPIMQNSTRTVYSSRNFESDYYFDELQMNELFAKEVFDEIPDREEYHYPKLIWLFTMNMMMIMIF